MTHKIKIQKQYYEAVRTWDKTFEVRLNDRDYKRGDYVRLEEVEGLEYTGRAIMCQIKYILEGGQFGIADDYVVFSIKILYAVE